MQRPRSAFHSTWSWMWQHLGKAYGESVVITSIRTDRATHQRPCLLCDARSVYLRFDNRDENGTGHDLFSFHTSRTRSQSGLECSTTDSDVADG